MRSAVISDLHLGTRLESDVLRRPEVRARLFDALGDVDRVVLLGDVLELRQRPVAEVLEIAGCGGALGPSLCSGATERQFPVNPDPAPGESPFQEMIDFITVGSELGIGYGQTGQGSGKMPGFGQRPEEEELFWIAKNEPREFPIEGEGDEVMNTGMLTPDMIEDIIDYERGL